MQVQLWSLSEKFVSEANSSFNTKVVESSGRSLPRFLCLLNSQALPNQLIMGLNIDILDQFILSQHLPLEIKQKLNHHIVVTIAEHACKEGFKAVNILCANVSCEI